MRWLACAFCLVWASVACADGPQDNLADKVRRVPPPGIAIADKDRDELTAGADSLNRSIAALTSHLSGKPELLALVPDVEIYYNAVRYALKYDEFYTPGEVAIARKLLAQGNERAALLRDGKSPWVTATGLVVRGYRSKIDDSVQPYGLVVPSTYQSGVGKKHRLDLWFHGRGEKLSELSFVEGRQKDKGQFTPADTFVLHPYGRYCNANHFAGEIDTLEALEHAKRYYSIDDDRIVVRGFSMGGAACWNFAVHYTDRWAAAAPGAGFSETPDFLKVFQNENYQPPVYEKKLLHWYDCTDWALNLTHCPTVAYSGENDKQKQAADIMAQAFQREGMKLTHIIGPKTGHSYHPEAKQEISRLIDDFAAKGRDTMPKQIRFVTYTLRYNRMHWVSVEALQQHWEQARVDADLSGHRVALKTQNVTELLLSFPPGKSPFDANQSVTVLVDGQELPGPKMGADGTLSARFALEQGKWRPGARTDITKRHGLQGPIDDAFMDRFVMVTPTGKARHEKVGQWIQSEMEHAIDHWRRQFRGELKTVRDVDVTPDLIANSNLVLWGDPQSNQVLGKIANKLPIRWESNQVTAGSQRFESPHHLPVLVSPNPLNPKKYVVLNSGFTFREYDYLNNARQIAKLPDWAILDIRQPRTSRTPAGIASAGFFDEHWRFPATTNR